MDDSANIFIAESQDMNLDCEIADEALEAVAQIAGGCPTLMYNSYCLYLRQRSSLDNADQIKGSVVGWGCRVPVWIIGGQTFAHVRS
jgi:hypothetical protein